MSADPTALGQQNSITAFVMKRPAQIDTLVLDCSITETHTVANDVTEHPVETGFNVTDHVRAKPDELTIEGIVTNTPFSQTQRTRIVQALGITFASATDADQILGQPGYAEAAYTSLRDVRDSGRLITITTSLRTYENMVMTSLVVPRNKDVGDALRFTAQFKRVRVVSNKLAAAKKSSSPAKTVKNGKQAPKGTDAATQKKSLAYQAKEALPKIADAVRGMMGGAP
jgi:hypothetical protein